MAIKLPNEVIDVIFDFYNPYKEYYKYYVLHQLYDVTLGIWYIGEMRDTVRNYLWVKGTVPEFEAVVNGKIYGGNVSPPKSCYFFCEYKFIQGNPNRKVGI